MPKIKNIDANTLNKWMQNNEVFLVDVREIFEYNVERIATAKNIPLAQIHLEDIESSDYKDKKVVMQCRSGIRSMTACEELFKIDPSLELYNLEGGILDWKKYGYKVEH